MKKFIVSAFVWVLIAFAGMPILTNGEIVRLPADPFPEEISAATDATLLKIVVSSFKGGRLEPYNIKLDQPFDRMQTEYTVTVDSGSRTSKVMYISPVTYSPEASCTVNGSPTPLGIPFKADIKEGDNKFVIEVTSKEGTQKTTYHLTIIAKDLWKGYVSAQIEPGVFRIQDASGFTTNEDQYLFIGKERALLFDTGMGEGDLSAFVRTLTDKPIVLAITHANGDHYGKNIQFPDSTVYWPRKEFNAIPDNLLPYIDKYIPFDDGDIIDVLGPGERTFEVVEVVGHTTGCATFLSSDKKYLITGDAISSGSYVFNFGANKGSVQTTNRDLKKLEAKLADVDGIYLLTGHSWQEPVPLQGAAGKQLITDMRIATQMVLDGKMAGKVTTRDLRGNIEELAQLKYGLAGYWYNNWDIHTPDSAIEFIQAWSDAQKRGVLKPNFSTFNTQYTATVGKDEASIKLQAFGYTPATTLTLNGAALGNGEERTMPLAPGLNTFTFIGSDPKGKTSTYTLVVKRGDEGELPPAPVSPSITGKTESDARLLDIKIGAFKGNIEPYTIPIPNFDKDTYEYSVTVNPDSRSGANVVYLKPVTYSPTATFTINGTPTDFNVPIMYPIVLGDNPFVIEVTAPNGTDKKTYRLNIQGKDMWKEYVSWKIEDGVWRIQDNGGFITNEDMYLFEGPTGAILFDTGMGQGNLRGYVTSLLSDPSKKLTVVITHAGGDHHGQNEQFKDCTIYYPEKDYPRLPATYTFTNYRLVKDGGIIDVIGGRTFKAVEVVGHTPGGMVYLDSERIYAISGDEISSGSYIFNFGSGRGSVEQFYRDMLKLEALVAEWDGVHILPGHSWQQPVPLVGVAGKQLITDMRMIAGQVLVGEVKGELNTRVRGKFVEPLRQATYRWAGFWYNGWDRVPHPASLQQLQVFSKAQNRDLLQPGFSSYAVNYTAEVKAAESSVEIKVVPYNAVYRSITVAGRAAFAGGPVAVTLTAGETVIPVTVTAMDGSTKTYTVKVSRPTP